MGKNIVIAVLGILLIIAVAIIILPSKDDFQHRVGIKGVSVELELDEDLVLKIGKCVMEKQYAEFFDVNKVILKAEKRNNIWVVRNELDPYTPASENGDYTVSVGGRYYVLIDDISKRIQTYYCP